VTRLVKLCALCVAGVAHASGFYLGDNGAKAMLQGGAFTAQADDATAMQHNPAGLAQQPGFSFLADLQVIRHDVSYLRQDPGFDPANPSTIINKVNNVPEPFLLPFFAATYGFPIAGRTFTVGVGLFAPPSQGRYKYPEPNYTKDGMTYAERPNKYSPQRYALITNDIIIAYPTLSLAYDIHPRIQVGISAQLTVSQFQQSQMMYGGDALGSNPTRQTMENPDYDARVAIDLPGQVGFTGILGLMARPTDWLSIGASFRPPIPFKSRGKITVDLPQFFVDANAQVVGANGGSCSSAAQATVTNCEAELVMTLPAELKIGARVVPIEGLGINVDFTYQGWNSIDQLLLTPQSVSLESMGNSTPIAAFGVKKNWMATFSGRVGATYRVIKYLSVSAGALYETGAAPTSTYSVDWTHPSRFIFTGGVTGHLGPIDLIAGALFTPTVTTVVGDSIVARGQTNPEIAPPVGNGIYTSGAWGLNFGVRGHFGAAPPVAKPLVAPAAAPEVAPELAPAATPVPDGKP
jgi:long-chain fatty acid transport protein